MDGALICRATRRYILQFRGSTTGASSGRGQELEGKPLEERDEMNATRKLGETKPPPQVELTFR